MQARQARAGAPAGRARGDAGWSFRAVRVDLRAALGVWALLGVVVLAIFVTYARTPVSDLYHVSRSGVAGGASRALVFLSFPVAFIAVGLTIVATGRLVALAATGRRRSGVLALAGVSIGLCLVAAVPGVVDQGDLDAKWVNLLPALGVALALVLTFDAARRTPEDEPRSRTKLDRARLVAVLALAALALPWILADLGVYVGDVPLLGRPFMSTDVPAGETLPVVHLGHHHGLDGALFAVSALALLPAIGFASTFRERVILAGYLALMLVYGMANLVQDFWGEQIVKRGWTERELGSVLRPELSQAWGVLLLATAVVWFVLLAADLSPSLPAGEAARRGGGPGDDAGDGRRPLQ